MSTEAHQSLEHSERNELENKAKVAVLGNFGERDLIGHLITTSRKTTKELEQQIESAWKTKLRENPKMYPGPMLMVKTWWLENKQLHLALGYTDFREYIGTRRLQDLRRYSYYHLANPIGVSTALITADGKLVIAKRLSGDKTDFIDAIGGYVSPTEDLISSGRVDFFHAAKREIAEELDFKNVQELERFISNIRCLGLIYEYAELCHPQLVFVARTTLSSKDIEPRISEEIKPIIVNLDQQSPTLKDLLKAFYPRVEPDGRIAMALARKVELGKAYQPRLLRTPKEV